eukprot:TRINITY_DN62961_c0_g1_i1.p2 TRINITY_DN62961_c0_g1~~TRINITY_DN62961_c0_g1_i1.p2  ORF type:complete len:274 (+),score=41.95 TRINITY_DN62961_c0_g1_i1:68-889(+)
MHLAVKIIIFAVLAVLCFVVTVFIVVNPKKVRAKPRAPALKREDLQKQLLAIKGGSEDEEEHTAEDKLRAMQLLQQDSGYVGSLSTSVMEELGSTSGGGMGAVDDNFRSALIMAMPVAAAIVGLVIYKIVRKVYDKQSTALENERKKEEYKDNTKTSMENRAKKRALNAIEKQRKKEEAEKLSAILLRMKEEDAKLRAKEDAEEAEQKRLEKLEAWIEKEVKWSQRREILKILHAENARADEERKARGETNKAAIQLNQPKAKGTPGRTGKRK